MTIFQRRRGAETGRIRITTITMYAYELTARLLQFLSNTPIERVASLTLPNAIPWKYHSLSQNVSKKTIRIRQEPCKMSKSGGEDNYCESIIFRIIFLHHFLDENQSDDCWHSMHFDCFREHLTTYYDHNVCIVWFRQKTYMKPSLENHNFDKIQDNPTKILSEKDWNVRKLCTFFASDSKNVEKINLHKNSSNHSWTQSCTCMYTVSVTIPMAYALEM